MKRVLLFVVDACTSRVLEPLLAKGELPVLAGLAAAGTLDLTCTSVFPSITPAATSSIITGRYPRDHGIAGMSWMDAETRRVTYFGDDVWTVVQRGIGPYLKDFLLRLNGDLLKAPTLMQTAERRGLTAGCFNYLIFRGDVVHQATPPMLLRLWPGTPSAFTVQGPSTLCLGDFVSDRPRRRDLLPSGGVFRRFGLDDQGTEAFLAGVGHAGALPQFNVAYFADYDFNAHERGPEAACDTLRRVDERLGRVFEGWGGLERVLEDVCIVLTADHSQSEVRAEDAGIALADTLDGFQLGDPVGGWEEGDDVMVCPNMRTAEVYLRQVTSAQARRVCAKLLEDSRIDQVVWKDPGDPDGTFRVSTADRGEVRFWSAGGADSVEDQYHGWWRCEGDLAAVDATVDGERRLRYGAYPNAFERVAGGFGPARQGRLLATARLGFEFAVTGQDPHTGGGSHGTLHALDSIVPLLVAGAPPGVRIPPHPRIVDVEPLCRQVLGIEQEIPPGVSRARA